MRLHQEQSASLLMYVLTLLLEAPVVLLRLLFAWTLATITLAVTGHPTTGAGIWADLALLPTGWSLLALVWPGGSGWWWRQRIGGRAPSQRERLAYADAVELLQDNADEPLVLPRTWFVLDTPEPDAAVIGDALMLSRGLLEGPHLPAVIAHELGHLATPDGRITAALNRLVIHSPTYQREPRKPLALIRGGLGLRLLRPLWGHYWREREYVADRYAARLGQADELADFLEVHALIHDYPIPFVWLTEHTHPPSEHRVDRLRASFTRRLR